MVQDSNSRLPKELTDKAIREQLARVLAGQDFDGAGQIADLLQFIVDESLASRTNHLKAYTIAIEVFNRTSQFDPQTDPIVRVQAHKLRRALRNYYLSEGRGDPVIIEIPRGAYLPRFRTNDELVQDLTDSALQSQPAGVAAASKIQDLKLT